MKYLQFLKKVQENFAIFYNFLKILSNYWRTFGHQFRQFRNMQFKGVRVAQPPDASEFMEI